MTTPIFHPGTADRAGTLVRLISPPSLDDRVRVEIATGPFSPSPEHLAEVTGCHPGGSLSVDWLDEQGDILASGWVDQTLVEVVKPNDPTIK